MNTIRRSVAVACTSLALAAHAQQARPADTYNAASGMLARGLNDLAAEEYARFLEANPEHELAKQARYGLGVAQSRLSNHEATIEALEPLLSDQRFQFIVESSLLSARSMLATDDPKNAARVLRQVIRRHDGHALVGQAASLYVESLYRADDLNACVRAYDEHESLMTGALRERAAYCAAMAEYKEGNLREAVMRLGRLEGGSTPIAASARLMLARTLQQMGDLEAARSAYRNAKDKSQGVQSIEISLGLTQVLIDLNSLDEASRELGEIPESGLDAALATRVDLERGRLAVFQGNHAQADRVLRRLISHAPESLTSSVRYWHARAQAGMGQHEEASLTLARVLNDDPESALRHEIMYQLGLSLGSVGKHAEAVQTLRALAQEASLRAKPRSMPRISQPRARTNGAITTQPPGRLANSSTNYPAITSSRPLPAIGSGCRRSNSVRRPLPLAPSNLSLRRATRMSVSCRDCLLSPTARLLKNGGKTPPGGSTAMSHWVPTGSLARVIW